MSYYDARETRAPAQREAELMQQLPQQIAYAKARSVYYAEALAAVDATQITTRQALASLPLTRKRDLLELQKQRPPFGGLEAISRQATRRVFASPGPIYELQGTNVDPWRMARVLYAAGFRAGDLIHNCFSYHFTPGAFMFEGGAAALGCAVFAGGVGQTEQQVLAMAALRPDGYVGTPSFLRIILEKADEMGADVSSLTKAMVSGEALPKPVRQALNERGITVRQCYATADLGAIAYESAAEEGLIVDEDILLEIVRPGTGEPVAEGEVGELVVTTFNPDYPLIRFATGDLSAILPGVSPCGRTNVRIKGWMGRADQTTKVKGMFVHPEQVSEVAKRFPELGRVRLVVDNPDSQDRMTLHYEATTNPPDLAPALITALREVTKLRAEVTHFPLGTLANDGKVIDDVRKYD